MQITNLSQLSKVLQSVNNQKLISKLKASVAKTLLKHGRKNSTNCVYDLRYGVFNVFIELFDDATYWLDFVLRINADKDFIGSVTVVIRVLDKPCYYEIPERKIDER